MEKLEENLVEINDKETQKNQIDWNYLFNNNSSDTISLDLSPYAIHSISKEFSTFFSKLKYLYLEGSSLTEIDEELFPTLNDLRWLDVRNNKITTVPRTIADHPSLEVLLLEGNIIENLPVEIGSLKRLRGLQLARNPIEYPPESVISQGVAATIEYLRRQWNQLQSPKMIQLVSETHQNLHKKSSATRKCRPGGSKSAVPRRKVRSGRGVGGTVGGGGGLGECMSVRPLSRRRPNAIDAAKHRLTNWTQDITEDFYPSYDKITHNRNRSMSYDKVRSNPCEEVQPKFIRDLWIEKIRQVLITQDTIIQRRKNAEAMKQWQDETKMQKQTNPRKGSDVEINFPFDTDPKCLRMLSRKDLKATDVSHNKRRDSSLHNNRHEEPINDRIESIMVALQELQSSQSVEARSPRSDQKALAEEIRKIKEIQRSLNALKLKNFGQLGI